MISHFKEINITFKIIYIVTLGLHFNVLNIKIYKQKENLLICSLYYILYKQRKAFSFFHQTGPIHSRGKLIYLGGGSLKYLN